MANSEKRLCIIGSGPAGCYLAEHLLKLLPEARVDVLEKLPVPFGLIRYGVAPDHQSTKGAARVLDRTLSRDRVRFFGNVEVGKDVTLNELRSMYHVVVLATGAPRDRVLGIPGEDLPGVIGSGAFVNWYNGHPSRTVPHLNGVRSAVIIGNGNVALDVARILAKPGDELRGSDLTPDVFAALRSQPIEDIHIVGRRGAAEAKFSPSELKEIGTLQRAKPIVADSNAISGDTPVEQVLREFPTDDRTGLPVTIHFHFGLVPWAFSDGDESLPTEVREGKEEISGAEAPTSFQPSERWPEGRLYPGDRLYPGARLQSVLFRSTSGEELEIPAQLAVTCIGYEAVPCCTAAPAKGVFSNDGGKIDDGLYVVGWAKRGPSGTIPTNRAEALEVAQKIVSEIAAAPEKSGADLTDILQSRGVVWTDYAGWKRIEEAERAGASDERCRLKLLRTGEMMQIARQTDLELKGN
jgi:NADPH-dependent glutamate synthase beta subunit-like oxidoreductase